MIDAVITGRSLPALQTALDLAEVGLSVALLGPAAHEAVTPWAESDPEGTVSAFIQRIAEPIEHDGQQSLSEPEGHAAVRHIPPKAPLLQRQGEWLRQATPETLGVPAVPIAAENIALLGFAGASRAYLDRITPLLTLGKTRLFGELVRKRMGVKVLERLVDPRVFARYGVVAEDVEVAVAAPGLNEALSRLGALSSAVLAYSDRNVARETRVSPAQGAAKFHQSVIRRLELYEVRVSDSRLSRIEQHSEGWSVHLSDGSELKARTLIADVGRNPAPNQTIREFVHGIMPTETRVHAEIDIEPPVWLAPGEIAVTLVAGWAAVIESRDDRCVASFSSGVGESEDLAEMLYRLEHSMNLPFLLETLGLSARGGSVLSDVGLAAAPFRTLSARDDAAANLEQLEQSSPYILPVGRAIYGDDQGAALDGAHASAVHLRRRLLGLED